MTTAVDLAAEPFLLRFATPRSADVDMPGRYSTELAVWVVDADGEERPIVEVAGGTLAATSTKTMTQVEVDDDDQGRGATMETATFTRVKQEGDDEDAMLGLPELQTKTEARQERDDEESMPL